MRKRPNPCTIQPRDIKDLALSIELLLLVESLAL
jgi:hypothetical protein